MISKEHQIQFYEDELHELELDFKKIYLSSAYSLFQEGELFIGQYKGFDEKRGNVFFDFPEGDSFTIPRIDKSLNCFKLKEGNNQPVHWKETNQTYQDLVESLNSIIDISETKIIDYIKADRKGWITIILHNMDMQFLDSLQYNQVLGFGPIFPPFEYLNNLLSFSEKINLDGDTPWDDTLNFKFEYISDLKPKILSERIDIAGFVIKETIKNNLFIFQGPPGTGKTYQIADVVNRLAKDGKSVLITALTNKASIEVCEKPFLQELMLEGKVLKTRLQSSEKIKFPYLINTNEINAINGHIVLSTYYQFSKIWESHEQSFDYVIVEESSQAFLTTIAAAQKVGKKIIIVGDPYQIQPIVKYKDYKTTSNHIDMLVYGLQTFCNFKGLPFYRKIETRRLTSRATEYTNVFYQNTMESKSIVKNLSSDKNDLAFLGEYIHPNGGPTLILKPLQNNNIQSMIPFLVSAINDITSHKKGSVAILTPFISTLVYLQKSLKLKTKSKKYIVNTVDSVQGLDVDFCFYIIPEKNYSFSFYLNRFNVATSRSKKATFILADIHFYRKCDLAGNTGRFIVDLLNDFCFVEEQGRLVRKEINLSSDTANKPHNISIPVRDKIKDHSGNAARQKRPVVHANKSSITWEGKKKKLNSSIDEIEVAIRKVIIDALGDEVISLPDHLTKNARERISALLKKDATKRPEDFQALSDLIEYFDMRDLEKVILNKSLWKEFSGFFRQKEYFKKKHSQLADLRNLIKHSRKEDQVIVKEGEASILWFEKLFK